MVLQDEEKSEDLIKAELQAKLELLQPNKMGNRLYHGMNFFSKEEQDVFAEFLADMAMIGSAFGVDAFQKFLIEEANKKIKRIADAGGGLLQSPSFPRVTIRRFLPSEFSLFFLSRLLL